MLDLSLQTVLYRLVAMAVLVGIHGLSIALVARLFGAKGPQYDGRLTPNPLVHLDLLATIPFILFQIGWIRPVAIDAAELRGGKASLWAVAMLSLLLTLAAIMLIWLARPWLATVIPNVAAASAATTAIRVLLEMTTWFVIINILPIPPLTMGMALGSIAPRAFALATRYGLVVRLALIALAALAAGLALRPVFQAVFSMVSLGRA